MSSNDPVEVTVEEADRRAERAKASLLSRVEALKHKFNDAKHKVDVRSQIALHPLPAVGVAFALGMLAGLGRTHTGERASTAGPTLAGAAGAALTALGLRLVRELALSQLGNLARQWLDGPDREPEGPEGPEAEASNLRDVEPFLEH